LVASGGLSLDEEPDLTASEAGRELIDRGFARTQYGAAQFLMPVEPARAIDHAILLRQQQLLDQYQLLVRLRDEMQELQRTFLSTTLAESDVSELVRIVTDSAEVRALSRELALSARTDVVSLESGVFATKPDPRAARTPPAEVVARGVRFRNVYARSALEVPGAPEMLRLSTEAGWICRVYPDVPMKMVIVDERAALLPISPTGVDGALLVRSPVIVAALRGYFELLWNAAVPVTGEPTKLSPEQDQILRLVLTGMTDAAIARHLGISERTVRRHVGALQETLRANNRVTLAANAVREGWVD
jgi:DNA-binding CsgD family transcriptional regulator